MKKLLKLLFNHERYQSISIILTVLFLIFLSACEPTCHSLLDPAKKITRTELNGEIDLIQARIDTELKDLEQQAAIRQLLISLASQYATSGTFPIGTAITGAIAMLGTGAVIDNFRKRKDVSVLEHKLEDRDEL